MGEGREYGFESQEKKSQEISQALVAGLRQTGMIRRVIGLFVGSIGSFEGATPASILALFYR